MSEFTDPFDPEQASRHESNIPFHRRQYTSPTMTDKEYYAEVQAENQTRRLTCDPISGFTWVVQTRFGRFSEGRPYLELVGSLSQHYVTPQASMQELEYPMHVMIPTGSTLLLDRMLQRSGYEATIELRKMDGSPSGDFATTYEVTGGTLKGFLNVLQQSGFLPPVGKTATRDGAPWHVSM